MTRRSIDWFTTVAWTQYQTPKRDKTVWNAVNTRLCKHIIGLTWNSNTRYRLQLIDRSSVCICGVANVHRYAACSLSGRGARRPRSLQIQSAAVLSRVGSSWNVTSSSDYFYFSEPRRTTGSMLGNACCVSQLRFDWRKDRVLWFTTAPSRSVLVLVLVLS